MNRIIKILGYGFLMWLLPFLVSLVIFPIKLSMTPLFESLMPVIISITLISLLILYFRGIETNFLKETVILGISWFLISICIDLILFLPPSPMQMSFTNYMMDIGITYIMIPVIAIGVGYMMTNTNVNIIIKN